MTLAYLASSSVAKFRLAWRIVSSVAMGKLFCSRIRVTSMDHHAVLTHGEA